MYVQAVLTGLLGYMDLPSQFKKISQLVPLNTYITKIMWAHSLVALHNRVNNAFKSCGPALIQTACQCLHFFLLFSADGICLYTKLCDRFLRYCAWESPGHHSIMFFSFWSFGCWYHSWSVVNSSRFEFARCSFSDKRNSPSNNYIAGKTGSKDLNTIFMLVSTFFLLHQQCTQFYFILLNVCCVYITYHSVYVYFKLFSLLVFFKVLFSSSISPKLYSLYYDVSCEWAHSEFWTTLNILHLAWKSHQTFVMPLFVVFPSARFGSWILLRWWTRSCSTPPGECKANNWWEHTKQHSPTATCR